MERSQIDIDVYRSIGPKRTEPLPGASSFFQERLEAWRELNAAEDWLAVLPSLHPLCQSLPQLLHHQKDVLDIILARINIAAALSLEPLLDLLAALARDIQDEFLPHMERVLSCFSDLIDEGGGREPEILQHVFSSLSMMCKHLCKCLCQDLVPVLKVSARLRYHRAQHVRKLAADTFGYLIRNAKKRSIRRSAMRLVLAEAIVRPSRARLHGAGALFASAMVGIDHSLHSRGVGVLKMLLEEDIVTSSDFAASDAPTEPQSGRFLREGGLARSPSTRLLTSEDIRGRKIAVISECMDALLEHIRRGKGSQLLWDIVLEDVDQRIQLVEDGADTDDAGTEGDALHQRIQSAACSLSLLCSMVEFHRGSRVEDYGPVFAVTKRVILSSSPTFWMQHNRHRGDGHESEPEDRDERASRQRSNIPFSASEEAEGHGAYMDLSMSGQILRLLKALVYAHCKAVGASEGITAIRKAAPFWLGIFSRAPRTQILEFVRSLITPPSGPEMARLFGPHLLSAVGNALLEDPRGDEVWPLLIDLCEYLSSENVLTSSERLYAPGGVPVASMAANGIGPQLEGIIKSTIRSFDEIDRTPMSAVWAALQCVPYTISSHDAAISMVGSLFRASWKRMESSCGLSEEMLHAILALHCSALRVLVRLVGSSAAQSGSNMELDADGSGSDGTTTRQESTFRRHGFGREELMNHAIALVEKYPTQYHAVNTAGEILTFLRDAFDNTKLSYLSDQSNMYCMAAILGRNCLISSSSQCRRAALRLLCAYEQPPLLDPNARLNASNVSKQQVEQGSLDAPEGVSPCDALPLLLSIESQSITIDAGRPAAVALGRIANYLEYRRIPSELLPSVIQSILGILRIRFALLWPAASMTLAAALDFEADVAWPLILDQLKVAQKEFLAGDCHARPRETDQDDAIFSKYLRDRFEAILSEGSEQVQADSTDGSTRLTHLLKSLAKSNGNMMERKAREWVPLFLEFSAAKTPDGIANHAEISIDDGHDDEDDENVLEDGAELTELESATHLFHVPVGIWRNALREWLSAISSIKGLRGVYQASSLQVSIAQHLLSTDQRLQKAALQSLRAFKLPWMKPYADRLIRLADNATLRSELAAFPLSPAPTSIREGDEVTQILPEHRRDLVPVIIALLYPKMRKRSGRLGGKGAPGSARAAILNFLSAANPEELRPLIELFLQPLDPVFVSPRDDRNDARIYHGKPSIYCSGLGLSGTSWWRRSLGDRSGEAWLSSIDVDALHSQPLRRRIGYLNAFEDLLKHLGYQVQQYLPELLSLLLVLLEGAARNLMAPTSTAPATTVTASNGADGMDIDEDKVLEDDRSRMERLEGSKEIRNRCLRIIASVLERFPRGADFGFLWQRLFEAVAPMLEKLCSDVSATSRCPAVMELCSSLLSSPRLMPVVANCDMVSPEDTLEEGMAPLLRPSTARWAKEQNFGADLLSMCLKSLSSPVCAEPPRNVMLTALENVFEMPDPFPDVLLKPHLSVLLEALQAIVVAVWQQPKAGMQRREKRSLRESMMRATGGTVPRQVTAKRSLAILELVGGRSSDWNTASQITDALLPLLQPAGNHRGGGKRNADEELISRALNALTALWSKLASCGEDERAISVRPASDYVEKLQRVASGLAPLAGSLESRESRAALSRGFLTVASLVPELRVSAETLEGLNAMAESRIDEPDYDKRLSTYSKMLTSFWMDVPYLGGAPLVYHCCKDLRNPDDLSLRQAAYQALQNLVDAAAQSASIERHDRDESMEVAPLRLVQRILFPQVKRSIGASSLAVRQEHASLLRHIALTMPDTYPELQRLTAKDEETDFWLNAVHLQLHRRARAFTRLARSLKNEAPVERGTGTEATAAVPVGVTMGLLVPILQQAILESRKKEDDAGHGLKQSDVDRSTNVADAAMQALKAVAMALPWIQYQELLGRWLRIMGRRSYDQTVTKAILRSVCIILDAFRFLDGDEANETSVCVSVDGTNAMKERPEDEDDIDGDAAAPGNAVVHNRNEPSRSEVVGFLNRRVIPELRNQMVAGETVRAPVAQAIVKVLKMMPPSIMRQELPRTIQIVANLLRLRLQRLRDDARAVMVAMAVDLGPEYISFFIEVLQASLPDRGFTAHVLGYTVHAVIEGVSEEAATKPGSLDDILDLVLPIIENEMFGVVSEAKEVDAFAANYKETKRCRAPDTFMLLASRVTFETHLVQLLGPIQSRLGDASSPKIRTKLSTLLQHAARGVLANPTMKSKDLCEFVYAVADTGLRSEEIALKLAREASGSAASSMAGAPWANAIAFMKEAESSVEEAQEAMASLHQPLMVEFALKILYQALKKGIIGTKGPQAAAQLDPLLPIFVRALKSRHTPTVMVALDSFTFLVNTDLPGLPTAATSAGKCVTDLLKRCPKTTHPIAQVCFKLLAGMLRHCEQYAPSPSHLKFVLNWAFTDLEESAQEQNAFSLLRAIIGRRLIAPEIYDLMERVQELMIRSQSHQIRQLASAVLLQFFLDYPLGKKRLDQHLQFLLANLSYEHESGRLAGLEMLAVMTEKFPIEILNSWSDTIFMPLVLRLVNDASSQCRKKASDVLRSLLRRLPQSPTRDRLAGHAVSWLRASDPRLCRAAAQALGLLLEVEGVAARQRVQAWLPSMSKVLQERAAALDADVDGENGYADDAFPRAPGWQEAYYCLVLLEKILTHMPQELYWENAAPHVHETWIAIGRLLLHRHVWVRKVAGRLIGAALADDAIGPLMMRAWSSSFDTTAPVPASNFGAITPAAGALALKFFRQLDSASADESIAAQAVKCMVFLSLSMYETDELLEKLPAPWKKPPSIAGRVDHDNRELMRGEEGEGRLHAHVDEDEDENNVDEDVHKKTFVGNGDDSEGNGTDDEAITKESVGLEEESSEGSLTVHGLVRRMVRLADDKSYVRQLQRGFALRFIAALASRLGRDKIVRFLPVLLRPLYRITEPGAAGNSEDITALADQVMSHLREMMGSETLLAAYNLARQSVTQQRTQRKQKAAVLGLVDPEAAAKRKLRVSQRKAASKKRVIEETRRLRAAGVHIKNRKNRHEKNAVSALRRKGK